MESRGRVVSPLALAALALVGAATAAGLLWRLTVRGVEQEIAQHQRGLSSLHLSGRVPPNREVMAYLTRRMDALSAQYQQAVSLVAPSLPQRPGDDDPQLAFQERVHEVQRTLERLTTARGMSIPLQLGLPKELPPAETVPRFLLQLTLIEELAEVIMTVDGVSQLVSFKAEDPRAVSAGEEAAFVTALPVHVHLSCALGALTTLLHLLDQAQPVMALQRMQVASSGALSGTGGPSSLDVELVVARYVVKE